MTRVLILATLNMMLATPPASAGCLMSYCKGDTAASSTRAITNTHRQKVADIYDPGHGQRLQVRDTSRRILFYIERDGWITNTRRQPVANIEALRD